MVTTELIIFKNLFENKEYTSKVLPFLKVQYFTVQRQDQRVIFKLIRAYIKEYKRMPTYTGIETALQKYDGISETVFKESINFLKEIKDLEKDDWDFLWLIDEAESFCKIAALEIAIMKGMDRIDKNEKISDLPDIMKTALSIDFNITLGLNYFSKDEINERWARYHEKKEKFPCKIEGLKRITNGGVERKTLNIFMGDTGAGKTSNLVSLACDYVENGYKVAYFSFEMDEYKICHRIDAHFLQTPINEIEFLEEEHYKATLSSMGYKDALIVKEYPEGMANIADIRLMIDDLKLKKNFIPDILFIDYINIMDSTRCTKQVGSYQYVKNITEEVRGFAKEYNIAIWSATQSNRAAGGRNDINKGDTSESYGLPMTVDLLMGIYATTAMKLRGVQVWKDMKDRYTGSEGKKVVISPNFATATARDYQGDTSDLLEEIEEVMNRDNRNDKIQNMHDIYSDENVDTTNEIKEEFKELLNDE